MLSYERVHESLRSEYERLSSHLGSLSDREISAPSACAGWSIADVTAHLAWNARLYVRSLTFALSGEIPQTPKTKEDSQPITANFVRDRAIELRRKLGRGLLESFTEHNERFITMLKGVNPAFRDQLTIPFINRLIPLRQLVGLRISEVALHSWDIRSPNDPGAELEEEAAIACIELRRETIERLLQPGWDVRVRIAPEGADGFDIVAHGGVPTTEPIFGKASATLNATPSTMALLLSGRRALNDDSVDIQGDVNIGNAFVERLVNS